MTALLIDIRPARPADAADLAEVHASAWSEAYAGLIPALTLRRMIARRGADWWREAVRRRAMLVLDAGGAVAGYASFAPARLSGQTGCAEIQELYLQPEYQGIGFGGRLFDATLKAIRAKGYGKVVVRAIAENERALAFYGRRGGRLVSQSDEALGGQSIACVWFEFRT